MQLHLPDIRHLEILAASIVVYPPGATLALRHATDHEFVWIMEGTSVAYFNDRPIPAPPGTILLRRKGMTDRYEWAQEHRTVHAYFHFTCDDPVEGWPPIDEWPHAQTAHGADILCPLFRYILNIHLVDEPERSALLIPAVNLLLKSFVTGRYAQAPEPSTALPLPVEKAMAYIQKSTFHDNAPLLTLSALARSAHVSPEHLCRLFKKSLKRGPLECARLARLQLASMLLGRSSMSIKEVSDSAGFATPYHFSRVFKDVYGMSPRPYRAAVFAGRPVPQNPIVRILPTGQG